MTGTASNPCFLLKKSFVYKMLVGFSSSVFVVMQVLLNIYSSFSLSPRLDTQTLNIFKTCLNKLQINVGTNLRNYFLQMLT